MFMDPIKAEAAQKFECLEVTIAADVKPVFKVNGKEITNLDYFSVHGWGDGMHPEFGASYTTTDSGGKPGGITATKHYSIHPPDPDAGDKAEASIKQEAIAAIRGWTS